MVLGLSSKHMELVERVNAVAHDGIADRASQYDRDAAFPVQDIEDLRQAGLLLCTLPEKDGGLGFGVNGSDPLSFFLIVERLAAISPATAHCFQVHCNAMQILREYGSDEQVKRFIQPTIEKGHLFVGAGSEPGGGRHSSTATPVDGGLKVTGVKHYATNATHSTWMTVHVRNEISELMETLVVNTNSPGLTIDASVWDPTGMRACVSPLLTFKDVIVPEDCIMADSEGFFKNLWLGKINFGFTANYLGGVQGLYEFTRDYLRDRGQKDNEVYQTALGTMKARLDAARLLFYNAASILPVDCEKALIASNQAKWLAVETANQFITEIGQLIGSSGFFRKYPVERLVRDLQVHTLHRRHHVGAGIVGQAELGLPYDLNKS